MSSVTIIRAILAASTTVTNIVPPARVYAGRAPQGFALPAVSITEVSGNEQPTVARDRPKTLIRSRVQVTVLAANYAQMKQLLLACKLGAGTHTGIVGAYEVNSVLPAGVNPEMPVDDANIYEQSRDFMVTFLETN